MTGTVAPQSGIICGMTAPDPRRREIGERIKNRRESLNLTQEQAARKARMNVSSWQRIEAGYPGNPALRTRAGLARALDWGPDAWERLLQGEEPAVVVLLSGDVSAEVIEALENDPALDEVSRSVALQYYRKLVSETWARRAQLP